MVFWPAPLRRDSAFALTLIQPKEGTLGEAVQALITNQDGRHGAGAQPLQGLSRLNATSNIEFAVGNTARIEKGLGAAALCAALMTVE